ncbi:MAG: hypothetical protein ACYSRP_08725 [Planctomycetota bacterium]|jgi:hypothetical protein
MGTKGVFIAVPYKNFIPFVLEAVVLALDLVLDKRGWRKNLEKS